MSATYTSVRPGDPITSDLMNFVLAKLQEFDTRISKLEAGTSVSQVQITGFGNFEARKRAARQGRNPKTGEMISIKASIAPAFRAGKQLKMAVNKK